MTASTDTPRAPDGEPDPLELAMAEVERLSKACTDAVRFLWGGRPVPPGEVREEAPTEPDEP